MGLSSLKIMASERYSFSLTTFSPSGKLMQIEYALQVVSSGAASVGLKASNGAVYSGMGPDYRQLIRRARKMAHQYKLVYGEPITTSEMVKRLATVMQEFTQSGGVRPFGVSLLIAGWDSGRPWLFQCDPSGAYFAWKSTAMGKNYVNGKTFLEKRYDDKLELEDAVHTAILTLKEGFEGQMTEDNIEIGICNEKGFRRLSPQEVKDYLANIA